LFSFTVAMATLDRSNAALSTIIEEMDSLHLHASLNPNSSYHFDSPTDEDGDDCDDFDDESWPEAPSPDQCLLFEQHQQLLHLHQPEDAATTGDSIQSPPLNIPRMMEMKSPLYMAEKPKSAKEAAEYIKEKYDALNRLRMEAGFGPVSGSGSLLNPDSCYGALNGGGSSSSSSSSSSSDSGYGRYSVTAAENYGYGTVRHQAPPPNTLPLSPPNSPPYSSSSFPNGVVPHTPQQVTSRPTSVLESPPIDFRPGDATPVAAAATAAVFGVPPNQQQQTNAFPSNSAMHSCGCGAAGHHPMVLSPQTVAQVELFYRSHKTDVYVCPCYAHLYQGITPPSYAQQHAALLAKAHGKQAKQTTQPISDLVAFPRDWTYAMTGVAVLLLEVEDEGKAKGGKGKGSGVRLSVLLAELSTGFLLWRTSVTNFTHYHAVQANFHVMRLAHDLAAFAGLAFEDPTSAMNLLQRMREFVARAAMGSSQALAMTSSLTTKKKANKQPANKKKPKKSDISSPCCFSHVTSLDHLDGLQLLGQSTPSGSLQRHQ
jgi:hypothetical protein